ncbi:MAG: sensor histidine kinase KdpD [Lentisphaerae bacterium]|nr:sensor histidine kinase KdpD [Lentisphaerota bacterium]
MPESPNPDALLADLRPPSTGRAPLKVFFGMCPGVGKTYAMLQAARQRGLEGVNVLVGVVETHGRAETAALLDGLTVLPRRPINYRGTALAEMDLDGILARRPALVVVDELAHSNAPGSRHAKRYQDVLELLDAGIAVFTTLNVQHIESRIEVVRQITGVAVRETVPDSILDRADEIQVIDVSPEQLQQRLSEGKVYLGDRADAAAANFFREGNLTALREMALRFTAERVDQDLRDFMRERKIPGPWKSSTRLLVGIGPSPFSESLIRWTRRAATTQDATWLAVYVDAGLALAEDDQRRVTQNLSLARALGAEVFTVSDPDVVAGLIRVAQENNVSQIVVGKPRGGGWARLIGRTTLVDQLLHRSGDIDLYIVRPERHGPGPAPLRHPVRLPGREFAFAAGLVAGVTGLGLLTQSIVGYRAVSLFYLCAVVLAALKLSRWPVLAAAASGAVLWDLLFVPPHFTLRIREFHDGMMFLMLFVVALAMGHLTSRLRGREQSERDRQRRTAALLRLSQHLASTHDPATAWAAVTAQLDELYDARTVLYLRGPDRRLATQPHPASSWTPSDKEQSVAAWSFDRKQPAGRGSDTLRESEGFYLPLQTSTSVMGVLGLKLNEPRTLDLMERDLLDSCASQIALALEKDHFRAAFQRAELIEQSERLRRTLLDNVSHELKTPVAAIRAALSIVRREPSAPAARGMLGEAEDAASRLERVVALLVDSAQLETGEVHPRPEWCDIHEVISLAQQNGGPLLNDGPLAVDVPETFPAIRLDPQLFAQAISHVLSNAVMHTPKGTRVELRARLAESMLVMTIADEGPGVPDTIRIFNKFYRGDAAKVGGLGLGLSISRGLIHALGGTIDAANRPGGGACFTITLPVETQNAVPE